jgi:hypothetical protein
MTCIRDDHTVKKWKYSDLEFFYRLANLIAGNNMYPSMSCLRSGFTVNNILWTLSSNTSICLKKERKYNAFQDNWPFVRQLLTLLTTRHQ